MHDVSIIPWETLTPMGFLTRFTQIGTGQKSPQWLCHPAGIRIIHIYVKQNTLHAFLNEQLDDIGYSRVYHDAVMNADALARSKLISAPSS